MHLKILLLTVVLLLPITNISAQKATTPFQAERLHQYTINRPEEKVYLHFDKDYYVPGETIWFKSYITIGGDHLPSTQSGLLYIDFYDQEDQFIKQLFIQKKNGFGQGHLDLPTDLKSKGIKVKAYTAWMRNFNMDFIFQKKLRLIQQDTDITVSSIEAEVRFFPEGGDLIAGITNQVAIKTNLNTDDQSFTLVNANEEEITEIEVNEKGYGRFSFKPDPDEIYFLRYQQEQFRLPEAQDNGISLGLNSYSNPSLVRITLRKKPNNTPDKVLAIVHTRGTVHFSTEIDFSRAAAIANIPKNLLPAGVNHLTIFDQEGKPLSERLFYIHRDDAVAMKVATSKTSHSTREKVAININLTDQLGENDLRGDFSLAAVQHTNAIDNKDKEDIKTYLLLNSDLRGQIENPGYYFRDQSIERKQALDLVMMTHGWRRFDWDNILNNPLDSIAFNPEKGITIAGRMLRLGNKKPIANGLVTYLDNQKGHMFMRNEVTNKKGEFTLTNLSHHDESKVVLKGVTSDKGLKRQSKQAIIFEMDSIVEVAPTPWLLDPVTSAPLDAATSKQLLEEARSRNYYDSIYNFEPDTRIVQGTTVEAKRDVSPNEVSAIYGRGTETYKIPDDPRAESYRDIFSYLQGKVPGLHVTITMNPVNTIVQLRSSVRIGVAVDEFGDPRPGGELPPKFVLNDMETDLQTLVYLPVAQISRVEVFKGPDAVAHGLNTMGGVIAVYTKTANDFDLSSKKELGLSTLTLPGFQAPREFFSPDYATSKPEHAKPDTRSLIHWQPRILTDSTGQAKAAFWTSDKTGTIEVNIQGLTYLGKPVSRTLFIEVKED